MSRYEAWQLAAERALDLAADATGSEQAGLQGLAAEARAIWPSLAPLEQEAVLATLRELAARVKADMVRLEGELQRTGERRAGVRGYGQLRSASRGQRLRRRA